MKSLVTGGAGFLGGHLVDALVERGDDVVVLDNLHRGRLENIQRHIDSQRLTFVKGDIRDAEAVTSAADGCEVIYHLAAQANVMGAVQDVEYSFTSNVIGTFNVLRAASLGSRRVVFSSSREVYGEPADVPVPEDALLAPKNFYGASKVAGEAYCRAWEKPDGLECVILRFANIYGPHDSGRVIPLWLDRAGRSEELELFGGQQILDFIWIGYAVEALLAAAVCPTNGPVNVGSGRGVPLTELADRVLSVTGSPSRLRYLPARDPEVTRFVADVGKMEGVLRVSAPRDPLEHLSLMVSGNGAAAVGGRDG